MARQLRIEYPGAFYHVFSRGNQRQLIFLSDEDMFIFLKCLREAHERFGVILHAYCLMPNHYHLIIETPMGNISAMMHFLNTTYTVYFNTRHLRCGHLFQGRYKSILIEAESYARELSRYIHLNPVRSKIVSLPGQYPWSSYAFYEGTARTEKWLETAFILDKFGKDPDEAKKAYVDFMTRANGKGGSEQLRDSMRIGILGSEEFIKRIKTEFLADKLSEPDREKPQLRRLQTKPDLALIFSVSEKVLGARNGFLIPIAIFVGHKSSALRLKEIAHSFSLSISGVSNACLKARAGVASNTALANAVEEIEREISNTVQRTNQDGVKPTFYSKR